MQDYGIELYFITDQIYLALSQQPRIILPCRPAENFLIRLETELKCKTLHLLLGSLRVSAISLWQGLTVI